MKFIFLFFQNPFQNPNEKLKNEKETHSFNQFNMIEITKKIKRKFLIK